jgi:hypothetical protein
MQATENKDHYYYNKTFPESDINNEFFFKYFNTEVRSPANQILIMMYYSFTTLTTVGFGDYNPRSDLERGCSVFILLFGVAVFSYIMSNFQQILQNFNKLNATIDESDELGNFFGMLCKYNDNISID